MDYKTLQELFDETHEKFLKIYSEIHGKRPNIIIGDIPDSSRKDLLDTDNKYLLEKISNICDATQGGAATIHELCVLDKKLKETDEFPTILMEKP